MSINIDTLVNRLQSLQRQTTEKGQKPASDIFKPSLGVQQIRIVPYVHNKENPFTELYFHYNVGKTCISPVTFGEADPILEFGKELQKAGTLEEWKLGKRLEPKMRVYAPVIVRGKEEEGVKFWGFGISIYEELLSYIADPDYGDITDPVSGRDIVLEVKSPQETGKTYQETTIRIKPKETPISNDPAIIEAVKNQKNVTELFTRYSYDEMREVLQEYLNKSEESEIQTNYTENTASTSTVSGKTTQDQIADQWKEIFGDDSNG